MAEALFWSSFIYITYVYMGYPLLLVAWRRLARRPVHKRYQEPSVSLVIAMHNERLHVERRMRNVRELDYPADKLRVIVSLDGPTDGTDTLVRDYAAAGVEVVHSPVRQGKAAALNSAVARAQGELVLFADARQQFERNAVRELAANFADDSVGAVSGELILLDATANEMKILGRQKALDGESGLLAHPALVGSRLYLRGSSEIVCLELDPAAKKD